MLHDFSSFMKQYTGQLRFVLIVSMGLLASCSTEETTNLAAIDKPVVEAYLVPGQKVNVHLTKQIGFGTSDTAQVPLDGLAVFIADDTKEYALNFLSDGNYQSGSDLVITEGKTYSLRFNYKDNVVSAETTIPTKPQNFAASASSFTVPTFDVGSGVRPEFPDPIKLTWTNAAHDYHLVVVQNIEIFPTAISFGFPGGGGSSSTLRPIFRNQPDQGVSYELNLQSFSYYGKHWLILYRINPEYAALYQQSGSSSLNLKNPSTNIKNGLGIFTGIGADTLSLKVN